MKYDSNYLPKISATGFIVLASLLLSACSGKPPGCAEKETFDSIRSIVIDNARTSANATFKKAYKDDPKKIQDGYFQNLKISMVNVVTNGYDEKAKKNLCKGNLSISTGAGDTLASEIIYSTQKTEDKGGGFVLEIEEFEPIVNAVVKNLNEYYVPARYSGDWTGSYSCAGINGATDGLQGPYTMPVTLVVDKRLSAKLERTTKGGGFETLFGNFLNSFNLGGEGQNSLDDTWSTNFVGKLQGLNYTAEGVVTGDQNRVLRTCTLDLKLTN